MPPHDLIACGHWCARGKPTHTPVFLSLLCTALDASAAAAAVAGLAFVAAAVVVVVVVAAAAAPFFLEPPALSADLEVPIFDYGLVTFLGTFFPGLVS